MKPTDRSLAGAGSIVLNEISFDSCLFKFSLVIHLRKIASIVLEEFRLNNDDLWEGRGGSEMHKFSSARLRNLPAIWQEG
jgi:hypothetical protein